MRVIIENDHKDISNWVSIYIKNKIINHNKNSNKPFILGLPTGSTPLLVYKYLIKFYNDGLLSFKNVITFNMDEYIGLNPNHIQSYNYFMHEHLFNHIDIKKENINILNGMSDDLKKECENYENKIKYLGGIDLFLCGVGSDGHIAFNEPGSSFKSITRIKTLSQETIIDNSRFFNNIEEVPTQALTVGIETIMSSKEIIIMAQGYKKSKAIKECIEGHISNQYTCTMAQLHPKAIIVCDENATNDIKVKTYKYYKNLQKLTDLQGNLITNPINKYINSQDKILITSPHPDDDVIGMGGTMQLFKNISNVKILYMTNGIGGLKQKDNTGGKTRIKEAISSIKVLGYEPEQIIDANLPFYNNKNRMVTDNDIIKMNTYLQDIQPNHLFICIDEDPNKTHIKCLNIIKKSILPKSIKFIWLYQSAWENNLKYNEIVYIPKDIFQKKLLSIDMHFSQKNPKISNKNIVSFKDIVLEHNQSHIYPGHFQEVFKRVSISDFYLSLP